MKRWQKACLAVVAGIALPVAAAAAPAYDVAANCSLAPELHYVVDGVDRTPMGGMLGDGNPVGFICTGNTYVPLRWLAETLGRAVTWDAATSTIGISASGAAQNGVAFHVARVTTSPPGTSVAVDVANATAKTAYTSFTVQFQDGYGKVVGTIDQPPPGADSFGKAEIAAGATQTLTVASAQDFFGYVQVVIVPWAAACPIACPPLPG